MSALRKAAIVGFPVAFGLFLIVMGVIVGSIDVTNYVETTATVTNVEEWPPDEEWNVDCDVGFAYEVEGRKYNGLFSHYSPVPEEGDEIVILYDPLTPSITTNTRIPHVYSVVLIVSGVVTLLLSVFLVLHIFLKEEVPPQTGTEQTKKEPPPSEAPPVKQTT